jgi:hypothetical protein
MKNKYQLWLDPGEGECPTISKECEDHLNFTIGGRIGFTTRGLSEFTPELDEDEMDLILGNLWEITRIDTCFKGHGMLYIIFARKE